MKKHIFSWYTGLKKIHFLNERIKKSEIIHKEYL